MKQKIMSGMRPTGKLHLGHYLGVIDNWVKLQEEYEREWAEEKRLKEEKELPKSIMSDILTNLDCAKEMDIPICQDTGMAIVFVEIGQDVHIVDGDFNTAVDNGVRKAYLDGKMRCSIVKDPIRRGNTNDNTPII